MNPILPLAYATPDVEAHVWPQNPNRVYLYCSNDRIDGGGMSPCQHCFSSEDLVHYYLTGHSLLRERKFLLSARRPALSPLRSLKSVWMPPMVPASACVKSTIPEAGQTGRNISAEFRRFPPFFPGNVGRSGSLPFRCRRTRSFRVQRCISIRETVTASMTGFHCRQEKPITGGYEAGSVNGQKVSLQLSNVGGIPSDEIRISKNISLGRSDGGCTD